MKSVISLSIFHCLLLLTFFTTNHGLSENVALNKAATSSSTWGGHDGYAADKATDGVLRGKYFFRSKDTDNQWWRTDLGEKFFIVDVKVYKRLTRRSGENTDPPLREAYLLLGNLTADPNLSSSDWNVVGNQKNEIDESHPNNYFGYNSRLVSTQLPIARFVVVYSEYDRGLGIDEVIVLGLARNFLRPSQLKAENEDTSDCVDISWEAALAGAVVYYEVRYDKGSWIPVGKSLSVQKCSVSPNQLLKIDVRVYGATVSESVQLRTCTTDPATPTQLSLGSGAKVDHEQRRRWQYSLTWQIPNDYGCAHPTSPYKIQINDTIIEDHTQTSYTLYADGYTSLSVSVWLRHKDGKISSTPGTITKRTEIGLPPQVAPRNFKLSAASSSCVSLSWDNVEYPNGPESGIVYQRICTKYGAWTDIDTNKQVCGYDPYNEVMCDIRAKAGSRKSETATAVSVRTSCTEPDLPTNLLGYILQERYTGLDSRRRIRIRLSIEPKDITANCKNIKSIGYTVDEGPFTGRLDYTTDLSPYTNYSVKVHIQNNKDLQRVTDLLLETVELEPYDGPVITNSGTFNQSCLTVSWEEPSEPNGLITNYQYKSFPSSNNSSDVVWIDSTPQISNTFIACGYESGDLVTYQVKAATSVGFGPSVEGKVTLVCLSTSKPIVAISNSSVTIEGRERILLTITWQDVEGLCMSISYYNLTVASGSRQIFHQQYHMSDNRSADIRYLDPYTNYTITLIAVNNENVSSDVSQYVVQTPQLFKSCTPPPVVENAEFTTIGVKWKLNTTVIYSCESEFKKQGNGILSCSWRNSMADWAGETPQCVLIETGSKSVEGWIVGIAVGLPSSVVIVILVIVLIVIVIKKRNLTTENPSEGIDKRQSELSEYEEIRLDPIPSELQMERGMPHGTTDNQPDQYETIDVNQREPDGQYEVIQSAGQSQGGQSEDGMVNTQVYENISSAPTSAKINAVTIDNDHMYAGMAKRIILNDMDIG